MSAETFLKAIFVAIIGLAVVIILAFPSNQNPVQTAAYIVFGILVGGGVIALFLKNQAGN